MSDDKFGIQLILDLNGTSSIVQRLEIIELVCDWSEFTRIEHVFPTWTYV